MKWNEIREKIKSSTDLMNVRAEKSAHANSNVSTLLETPTHSKQKMKIWIVVGAIVILIAIVIIWCIQSKKVIDYGPVTDTGITRQEAHDVQAFLEQIPLKPLISDERKPMEDSSKSLETKESGTVPPPVSKKTIK